MPSIRLRLLCAFLLAAIGGTLPAGAEEKQIPQCRTGPYQLSDGRMLVITPADAGNLRYTFGDGRAGKLFAIDGTRFEGGPGWRDRTPVAVRAEVIGCDEVRWRDGSATAIAGHRVAATVVPINVTHANITLYGELHLPDAAPPDTILVLQYGSGRDSAVEHQFLQHLLPRYGVGVVVFDKRGTGRSTGQYSADFDALSADMAAVVAKVRELPQSRGATIGLMGESQGGWVVPIAAEASAPDYLIVSYGLAISMLEENRQEVLNDLAAEGYDANVRAAATQVIEVTNRIMVSRFTQGLPELAALQRRYGRHAWFKTLSGDFTGLIANATPQELQGVRAAFDFAYDLEHDPKPTLERGRVPSLWILAGKDTEAPSDATLTVLEGARAAGAPIDIAIFPNADHGMIEVAGGPSAATRTLKASHSPGYFELIVDWARHRRFRGSYGSANLRPLGSK